MLTKINASLFAKLTSATALVLIIVLGISTYIQWQGKKGMLLSQLHEEGENLNSILDSALHDAMLKADMETLDSLMANIGGTKIIKRIYILNAEGKLYSSSDKAATATIDGEEAISSIKNAGDYFFDIRTTSDDEPYMVGLSPVETKEACLTCHSDSKAGEPLGYLGLERWVKRNFEQMRAGLWYSILMNIAIILILFCALFLLARRIVRPITKMTDVAGKIAIGNIDQTIDHRSTDEIGNLAESFRKMIETLKTKAYAATQIANGNLNVEVRAVSNEDVLGNAMVGMKANIAAMIEDVHMLANQAVEGNLAVRADAAKHNGDFAKIVQGINDTLDAVVMPINEATLVLEQVAAGNLAARVKGEYKGDHAKIKNALNKATEDLEASLHRVSLAATHVAAASAQISSGSQSMAQGASEQASSLEEVSSSLQELSSMTRQNVATAKEAKNLTEGTRLAASKGVESMNRLSAAIGLIKSSSDDTAKIVKTIDEIAFQTNLLALNAAVEAARAGDAGKGFAVVAEEVRNLAMRSAEAAKNTALLIEEAVKNADSGVSLNEDVLKNLQAINGHIDKVGEMMAEIVAASEQQSQGIDQINTAIEQMNQVTQQNAANSEESASAAEELSSQAEEMRSMVNSFKLTQLNMNKSAGFAERQASPAKFYPAAVNPLSKTAGLDSHRRAKRTQETVKSPAELIPFDDGLGSAPLQEEDNLILSKF